MTVDSEFVEYLLELLEDFGDVNAKRMFGGFGMYRDGLMFGLVDKNTLFLKADDENRPDFEELDLPPFTYLRQGKPIVAYVPHVEKFRIMIEGFELNRMPVAHSIEGAVLMAEAMRRCKPC